MAEQQAQFEYVSDAEGFSPVTPTPKKKRRKGPVILIVLVILLALGGGAAWGVTNYINSLNKNLEGDGLEEAKEQLTPSTLGNDPFYMMFIGTDDREGVEGARSDTAILVRIDPSTNQMTMLSIPRDTAIYIDGDKTIEKFNAAYAYGGSAGTIKAASELCGVDISHYAEVHFEALIDIIDYIGGVEVDVPLAIDDEDAGGALDAGVQVLNGEQAMIFARSRAYVTGDFQRTTNQRTLIEAAMKKIMSLPATEYPGLIEKISKSVTTDLSVSDIVSLAQNMQDTGEVTIYSAMVPSDVTMYQDVSYVVCNVPKLQEMMNLIDKGGDPATLAEDWTVSSSAESAAASATEGEAAPAAPVAPDETAVIASDTYVEPYTDYTADAYTYTDTYTDYTDGTDTYGYVGETYAPDVSYPPETTYPAQ